MDRHSDNARPRCSVHQSAFSAFCRNLVGCTRSSELLSCVPVRGSRSSFLPGISFGYISRWSSFGRLQNLRKRNNVRLCLLDGGEHQATLNPVADLTRRHEVDRVVILAIGKWHQVIPGDPQPSKLAFSDHGRTECSFAVEAMLLLPLQNLALLLLRWLTPNVRCLRHSLRLPGS